MSLIEIKKAYELNKDIENVSLVGWIKFNRNSGKIGFIELTDGTTIKNLQIVYKRESLPNFNEVESFRLASAVKIVGDLKVSTNPKNPIEVLAKEITLLKEADEDFPLQNKQHNPEFLREIAHIKARSSTTQAIMKIRNELFFALHRFFYDNGFVWMASPIITSNDCEGAGENFVIQQDRMDPFFTGGTPSLTVSGQLNAESYALGLKKVYTFGPTFRAEKSHTNRHLAEFWMLEPEISFCDLPNLMIVIEQMFKTSIKVVLEKCKDEFAFLQKENKENNVEKLLKIIGSDFVKIEYCDAVEILKQAVANGVKFDDSNIFFGKDFASEHERYLCETHAKAPVFLYNFPKEIKAFYMKVNADNKTVAATDLLVPGVGEIVGGSQREDDYEKIKQRCADMKIDTKNLQWYLDLRRFGYASSAGFGLGFERILMYVTDIDNIKDTIPFPRANGELKF